MTLIGQAYILLFSIDGLISHITVSNMTKDVNQSKYLPKSTADKLFSLENDLFKFYRVLYQAANIKKASKKIAQELVRKKKEQDSTKPKDKPSRPSFQPSRRVFTPRGSRDVGHRLASSRYDDQVSSYHSKYMYRHNVGRKVKAI